MNRANSVNSVIWQPTVELTDTAVVPHQGERNQLSSLSLSPQEHVQPSGYYTKTSLKHDNNDADPAHQLNLRIINASQSHNSAPKPFFKQASLIPAAAAAAAPNREPVDSIERHANNNQHNNNHSLIESSATSSSCRHTIEHNEATATKAAAVETLIKQRQQQQQQQQLEGHYCTVKRQQVVEQREAQQEDKMSPQLVHKQYNSPLDLYSMNNIRKTIEAHSELLAPGVKGINFMKAESPINKQSEVYKLVKEEEERRNQQRSASASTLASSSARSPIYSQQQQQQPLADSQAPNVLISKQQNAINQHQQHRRAVQYAAEHNYSSVTSGYGSGGGGGGGAGGSATQPAAQALYQPMPSKLVAAAAAVSQSATGAPAASDHGNGPAPKCCECGQFIVGHFAKIQNRFVHPHCFNCSTCGTSLKNSGYFTISDKLYCEIHARQVANVMRLNYNFEPNKQTIDNTRQQYDEPVKSAPAKQQQQQVAVMQKKLVEDNLEQQQQRQQQQQHQHQHQVHSTTRDEPIIQQQQQQRQQQHLSSGQRCSNCCATLKNQAATISTMFSNRAGDCVGTGTGGSNCAGCNCRRSEIRWSWRPACGGGGGVATNNQQQSARALAESSVSSSTSNTVSHYSDQHHQINNNSNNNNQNKYDSRLVSSSASTLSNTNNSGTVAATMDRVPICCHCHIQIHGPYVLAGKTTWCKPCSQTNFVCSSCHCSLLTIGFIEDSQTRNKYYCENCFETYLAPVCSKCHVRIKDQDCLKALGKTWHPSCFVCGHCKNPFGNSSFYLEDNVPYCERDWNLLFTTKCFNCSYPIEAGDKWIEALDRNYHSDCFRCSSCQLKLEGSTFYCKGGKPYCRMHAR